ncbi:MAG: hypothetical protein GX640_14390 [Fibrobacter sp.]|nr:hypothetical protein [Fibrobacter sp.]
MTTSPIVIVVLVLVRLLYSDIHDNGPGMNFTFGTLSGGLGLNFEYQIAYKAKCRITPTIGAGFADIWKPAFSIGVMNEIGYSNRFFTAIDFGTWMVQSYNHYSTMDGEISDTVVLYGPSVICGFKRVFENGRMLNVGVGISFPLNMKYWKVPVLPAFNIGYGFKFRKKNRHNDTETPEKSIPKRSLPKKFSFIKELDSVHYIVTDPKYLLTRVNNIDTGNMVYRLIKDKVYERVNRYSLQNFRELPDQYNRQVTVAFNNNAYKNGGILDSLPYALWEMGTNNNIRYFAIFYLYKTSEYAEVVREGVKYVSSTIPLLFL